MSARAGYSHGLTIAGALLFAGALHAALLLRGGRPIAPLADPAPQPAGS